MAKKNSSTWVVGPLSVLTMGSLMFAPAAHPQVVGATAKSSTAPSTTQGQIQAMQSQIQMMQGQVQELVARVKSLEDQAQLASGPDDVKPSKTLEQRLDALEREQAKPKDEESERHEANTNGPDRLTTVVAPFIVVDKDGKTIMRVAASDSNTDRGILVFNAAGQAVAQLGVTGWGGLLALMNSQSGAKEPDILLGISYEGPKLQLKERGKKLFELDKASLAFYGDNNAGLSVFGTKKRLKGYLELNDTNGNIMVEAGVLESNKGYVMATPWRPSPDVRGDPSVIKGGGK